MGARPVSWHTLGMPLFKISVLTAAMLLAGCSSLQRASSSLGCMLGQVTGSSRPACSPAPAMASQASDAAVQARFTQLQTVLDDEIQSARLSQSTAVAALEGQRAPAVAGPVQVIQVNITDKQSGLSRSMRALDAVSVEMPLAAKGSLAYTRAMDTLKALANQLADNRGAASILVDQTRADVQANRVNTATGISLSPSGKPVNVQKSVDPYLAEGLERYTIRAGEIRGQL